MVMVVVWSVSALSGGEAARALAKSTKGGDMELSLYTKTGMGDGQQANNPWLQEFPDPITRTTWDNYLQYLKQMLNLRSL